MQSSKLEGMGSVKCFTQCSKNMVPHIKYLNQANAGCYQVNMMIWSLCSAAEEHKQAGMLKSFRQTVLVV